MLKFFILKGRHAIEVPSMQEWAEWVMANPSGHVLAQDRVGEMEISTVFIGGWIFAHRKPYPLFETMIFGPPMDGYQMRYDDYEAAMAGHDLAHSLMQGPEAFKAWLASREEPDEAVN